MSATHSETDLLLEEAPPPIVEVRAVRKVSRLQVVLTLGVLLAVVAGPIMTGFLLGSRGPSWQSSEQRDRVEQARQAAISASAAARSALEALFSHPLLPQYLTDLGAAQLASLSGSALLESFWNELSAAELVHNFGDLDPAVANCGFDLRVHMALQHPEMHTFYNQWQLQSSGLVPVDTVNNVFVEWSEVNIFGFPPFQNVSNPDWKTSSDRPFYAAVNMYRGSGGNPQCGPIGAVLRRSYLNDQILAAAFDTGFFEGICANNQSAGGFFSTPIAICSAWPPGHRILGVPPYLDHLLIPYITFYNATQSLVGADNYPLLNLARLLVRLLSRSTYRVPEEGLPLFFLENTLGYLELNPAMEIDFSAGVKMLIATFDNVWGTTLGNQVRDWCVAHNWALAWAYNPLMSFRCGPAGGPNCQVPQNFTKGFDRANVRILDPYVLQRTLFNLTATPAQMTAFQTRWEQFNVTGMSQSVIATEWQSFLGDFGGSTLAIEPLWYQSCVSDDCVGVQITGNRSCVCPS